MSGNGSDRGDFDMATRVNLDAMIGREDLDITDNEPAQIKVSGEIKLGELEDSSSTFLILRKPDFQRETANWTPEKVFELVENFLDGDLIPSVIVWRSNRNGKLFVIDGAHRLSALIAWVHDDYGDKARSRALFGDLVDDKPNKKIADKTRSLMRQIGTYEDLKKYVKTPEGAPDQKALIRARNMGSVSITQQELRGDVAKAEKSFLKINQSATLIDATELTMIESRRKPNAIAARALVHAGRGHPYWGAFDEKTKALIQTLSQATYENLFNPILEYPIRTMQLPAAGLSLTPDSLDLVFNLVNHLNGATNPSTKKTPGAWKYPTADGKGLRDLDDDIKEGVVTTQFITKVRDATRLVFGPGKGSLSLHPGVYCYGATGRFLPTAFFTAIDFVRDLELHRRFARFTKVRAKFEDFLVGHRHYINQIAGEIGAQLRGVPAATKMYGIVFAGVEAGQSDQEITQRIVGEQELSFIRDITDDDRKYGRNFSRETSNMIYLREAMAHGPTCGICHARIRGKVVTLDHKTRKADGGLGSPANGQLAHPYCNDGYKEKLVHSGGLEP
jgi:hypothetical protein